MPTPKNFSEWSTDDDLRKDFPLITLRPISLTAAVDEVLWIWQKKSSNIHDLHSHIWDAWADETGSIGKAYGYQMGIKHQYKEACSIRWTGSFMT